MIRFPVILTVVCAVVATGCTQTTGGLSLLAPKPLKAAIHRSPIVRILCLWEPSEGVGVDGAPARGFAGQILFFNAMDASPVPVEGVVDIFEFDDQGSIEEQAQPIHKFTFESGAWNAHLVDGSLGPSYNVFIPYVRKHSWETTAALRVRLTPKKGLPLYSDLSSITLPGGENPNSLHARKKTVTGTVQEILQARLGDLGTDPATAADDTATTQKSESLDGRIRQGVKTAEHLRTLTIHGAAPPAAGNSSADRVDHAVAQEESGDADRTPRSRRRFRLTPAPGDPAASEHDSPTLDAFAPLEP